VIKRMLSEIAEDEQRHATLAWRTVRWILSTRPQLLALARETFDASLQDTGPTPAFDPGTGLEDWGVLSATEEAQIAKRVLSGVVAPCATALFAPASENTATA
jgi:hypothetical protein